MVRMDAYSVRNFILALGLLAALGACSGDRSDGDHAEPTMARRVEQLADCTPTDLVVVAPWMGPAFDPDTGELVEPLPEGHIEAVAQGWRKYDDEAQRLRMEHGQLVLTDLLTRDGFLGFESVESAGCDISIAHSLWRDEASMLAFVTSSPHADARASATSMHHAFAGAHWSNPTRAAAPTWREGIDRYVETMRARLE
jgi:heme-degrading monooxygenase HmoA